MAKFSFGVFVWVSEDTGRCQCSNTGMPHGTRQRRKLRTETGRISRTQTTESSSNYQKMCLRLAVVGVGVAVVFFLITRDQEPNPEQIAQYSEETASPVSTSSNSDQDLVNGDEELETLTDRVDIDQTTEWDWERKRSSRPQLSPEWIEHLINSFDAVDEEDTRLKVEPIDRNAVYQEARKNLKERKWMEAKKLYRHLLHYNPWDDQAMKELHYIYHQQYPEGPNGQTTFNFTKHFFTTIKQRLKQKAFVLDGQHISINKLHPNIYTLDNFFSDNECDYLIDLHQETMRNTSLPPLMCFQHDDFMASEMIKSNVIKGTYCLRQPLSLRVTPYLTWSYSTSHYRGEDPVVDRLERRIEEIGLRQGHARDLQLLSYQEGVSYNDHTDCFYKHKVTDHDKTATFLGYLQDENLEGGETTFPRLGISIKPKRGMAVIFYNFNGQNCDLNMMHQSSVVRKGTKVIAQKWYSYPDAPFYNERPYPAKIQSRLPYQPVVSCDYILAGGESSCRWYEHWPFPQTEGNS